MVLIQTEQEKIKCLVFVQLEDIFSISFLKLFILEKYGKGKKGKNGLYNLILFVEDNCIVHMIFLAAAASRIPLIKPILPKL